MKLGKLSAKFSDSDFLFKNLIRAAPVPENYDWDITHPGVPTPVFLNDQLGDCVMAGRAHQTLRFEMAEQKKLISISDDEVKAEYFRETGGADSGLVVSDSLRNWRRLGWYAGGKNYKIRAYARLDVANQYQVKSAIYADLGMGIGFDVPQSAMDQFNNGQPWTLVPGHNPSLGGHYVYCVGYDKDGITCVTWGRRQRMSWDFFSKYTDEAWAIFDANDVGRRFDHIDLPLLQQFLDKIKK